MISAGSLSSRVAIQQRSGSVGSDGTPSATWSEVCAVWGDIRHVSGLEQIRADGTISRVRASIRIRRRDDITAAMRVVHGAKIYDIKAVLPDEHGRGFLDLVCEATL